MTLDRFGNISMVHFFITGCVALGYVIWFRITGQDPSALALDIIFANIVINIAMNITWRIWWRRLNK